MKKISKFFFILFVVGIWLFPFNFIMRDWFFIGVSVVVVFISLLLKKYPWVGFGISLLSAVGMGLYSRDFLVCFSPVLIFVSSFLWAVFSPNPIQPKNDLLLCFQLLSMGIFGCVSLGLGVNQLWGAKMFANVFDRKYILMIVFACNLIWLYVLTYHKKTKRNIILIKRMRTVFLFGLFSCFPGSLCYDAASIEPNGILGFPLFALFLVILLEDNYLLDNLWQSKSRAE